MRGLSLSLLFVVLLSILVTAQQPQGSITVCKIIVDANGDTVAGELLPGSFEITPVDSPSQELPAAGEIETAEFSTPLNLNSDILLNDGINDAECHTNSGLAMGNYFYSDEVISGSGWNSPLLNDQHITSVFDLDDFSAYEFMGENTDVDGHIVLYEGREHRTVVFLNRALAACGNGIIDAGEQCDGSSGVGEHQVCSEECTLIDLTYCGDGILQNPNDEGVEEQCDGLDGVGENEQCSSECTIIDLPYCGDGIVNNDEQCDPPQDMCTPDYGLSCQYCSEACMFVEVTGEFCGDGIVNGPEECDGTDGVGENQACTDQCTIVNLDFCGDGIKNGNEECDGSSGVGEHQACTAQCTLTDLSYCGDGIVQNPNDEGVEEQCDGEDGLAQNQFCTNICTIQTISPPVFNSPPDSDAISRGTERQYQLYTAIPDRLCVRPGANSYIYTAVRNTGDFSVRNMQLVISETNLGIIEKSEHFTLLKKNSEARIIYFDVPQNAIEGIYYFRIASSGDDVNSQAIYRRIDIRNYC